MLRCHAHTQDRVVVAEVARLLALPSEEPFVLARVAVDRQDLGTRESHEPLQGGGAAKQCELP